MLLEWEKPEDVAFVQSYDLYLELGCDPKNYSDSMWMDELNLDVF